MDDPKCDACNRVENLKPCGFCGQPVIIRYNTMTGEHYISHEDWNSRCPQRPFYGGAEQWNNRHTEDVLRAEIIQWITANNAAIVLINEQQTEIIRLRTAITEVLSIIEPYYDEMHIEPILQAALDAAGGERCPMLSSTQGRQRMVSLLEIRDGACTN